MSTVYETNRRSRPEETLLAGEREIFSRTVAMYALLEEAADCAYQALKIPLIVRMEGLLGRRKLWRLGEREREALFGRLAKDGWARGEGALRLGGFERENEEQLSLLAGRIFVDAFQSRVKRLGSARVAYQTKGEAWEKTSEEVEELIDAAGDFSVYLSNEEKKELEPGFIKAVKEIRGFEGKDVGRFLGAVFSLARLFGVDSLDLVKFGIEKQKARMALEKLELSEEEKQQGILVLAEKYFGAQPVGLEDFRTAPFYRQLPWAKIQARQQEPDTFDLGKLNLKRERYFWGSEHLLTDLSTKKAMVVVNNLGRLIVVGADLQSTGFGQRGDWSQAKGLVRIKDFLPAEALNQKPVLFLDYGFLQNLASSEEGIRIVKELEGAGYRLWLTDMGFHLPREGEKWLTKLFGNRVIGRRNRPLFAGWGHSGRDGDSSYPEVLETSKVAQMLAVDWGKTEVGARLGLDAIAQRSDNPWAMAAERICSLAASQTCFSPEILLCGDKVADAIGLEAFKKLIQDISYGRTIVIGDDPRLARFAVQDGYNFIGVAKSDGFKIEHLLERLQEMSQVVFRVSAWNRFLLTGWGAEAQELLSAEEIEAAADFKVRYGQRREAEEREEQRRAREVEQEKDRQRFEALSAAERYQEALARAESSGALAENPEGTVSDLVHQFSQLYYAITFGEKAGILEEELDQLRHQLEIVKVSSKLVSARATVVELLAQKTALFNKKEA